MPEMGGSSQLLVHFCRGASAPGHSPRPLIGGFEENKSKTSDEARREIAKPCHPPKCRHPRKRVIQYSRGDRVQPSGRGVLDRRMRGDDERRVLDVLDPVIASAAKQSSFLSFSCGNGLLRCARNDERWTCAAPSIAQHDPRRRVVAGALLAAQLAVDAGFHQTRRERGAEQQMIQPQARVARPAVALVVPEGEDGFSGCSSRSASVQPCLTN